MDPVTGGVLGSLGTALIALVARFVEKRRGKHERVADAAALDATNVATMQSVVNSLTGRLSAIEVEVTTMHDQLLVAKLRLRRLEVWLIEKGYDPFEIAPYPTIGEDGRVNWGDYSEATGASGEAPTSPRPSAEPGRSAPVSPQPAVSTWIEGRPATTHPDSDGTSG